tara:strand:+ start:234 stop:428 length:195 start_codon:yes stop_codon:yes gene_type:complete
MKKEIERLNKIKLKVFKMYAHTEGINSEMNKKELVNLLKHVSFDIEDITNYIADEIDFLKRSIN